MLRKKLTENNIDEISISDIEKSHEMEMGKLKNEAAIVLKSACNDLKKCIIFYIESSGLSHYFINLNRTGNPYIPS